MEKKYIDNYKRCIEVWGIDAQIKMCIEEMSELTKALCKYKRYGDEKAIENIKEELADVFNCVEQLSYHFGYDDIEKIRCEKMERAMKKF